MTAPWRVWGAFPHTVSFKWPPELVAELADRRDQLREPAGLIVVAAVAHLLDQHDDAIRAVIDRAERAKPLAGPLTPPPSLTGQPPPGVRLTARRASRPIDPA